MHTSARKTTRKTIVGLALLASLCLLVPEAHAAGVYGPACSSVSYYTTDQCDNQINDDSNSYVGQFSSNCYGACGPGCSYNCGSGGDCLTHDYWTRAKGMWSAEALSKFPAAAAQWGACVMATGYYYASGYLKSAWSGIRRAASKVVYKIFN